MGVQLEPGRADGLTEGRDERADPLGLQQPAGVLEEDGVHAEGDELPGFAGIVGVRMHGAHGVHDAARHGEAGRLGGAYRNDHVAHVVERVVGGDVANAVGGDPSGRQGDDVVGKELEREQALASRHHDERGTGNDAAHDPHALPGIFAKVTHADIEDGAAHQVDGLETQTIDNRGHGQHHGRGHPRRP